MPKTATIRACIQPDLKDRAERIFQKLDRIVKSPKPVTPAKAGVHNQLKILDCGLRRNDDCDEI